ncbi:hypothetical protein [Bordetella hinzii]|uniref:hypothetical protein n=1 Tax=Bordetella hinzii TaxID=103855 RepID=UPI0007649570|nr:hypothetical protein [Bordetella hinzii]KXA71074.1 hypothetical protein AXA74_20440 [Bordetella hinzii LMG 13501]VEH23183.1 Uncharacterised protein [Bordetella hinzii]
MSATPENVLSVAEVQAIIKTGTERSATYDDFVRQVEVAVLDKLRRHDIEETIEKAYLDFTAMRDGRAEFAGDPWPERDAFKAHMRRFAYARYHELIGQVLRATGRVQP